MRGGGGGGDRREPAEREKTEHRFERRVSPQASEAALTVDGGPGVPSSHTVLARREGRGVPSPTAADLGPRTAAPPPPTLMRCLLTHLVKVFFCTRSRSSRRNEPVTQGLGEAPGG